MSRILTVIVLIFLLIPDISYGKSFFDQRYRGWIWFEEQERIETNAKLKQKTTEELAKKADYAKAREEVERFAEELEELKYMMIRYPENIEHTRTYRKKEAEMLSNALKLATTDRMKNFYYPNDFNLLQNPQNLYGRRIKEDIDKQTNTDQIKEFAASVELFLFFSSSCPYCLQIEPVLADFVAKYGFKCEAVSLDGSTSRYFKTHQDQGLATQLELKQTPTVIAVTNDSGIRFELIRGAASLADLEEMSLLGNKYLKRQSNLKQSDHDISKN
jgi:conjugal transfer pilus assembly protein TraF